MVRYQRYSRPLQCCAFTSESKPKSRCRQPKQQHHRANPILKHGWYEYTNAYVCAPCPWDVARCVTQSAFSPAADSSMDASCKPFSTPATASVSRVVSAEASALPFTPGCFSVFLFVESFMRCLPAPAVPDGCELLASVSKRSISFCAAAIF